MRRGAWAERYLAAVTPGLVGSRRSRIRLLTELEDHLEDAVASKVAQGVDRAEAQRQALAEIGDATAIVSAWRGRTERVRRRQLARVVLAVVFAFTAAAVLGIASAASGHRPRTGGPVRTGTDSQAGAHGRWQASPPGIHAPGRPAR